jgi:hypothetical protein
MISNRPDLNLEEIQHVEPFEYTDKYAPSKYGIIFKEKLFVGPDHTSAAFNIRLRNKEGKDLDSHRLFKLEIFDQGKIIFSEEGYNQITVPHFMFRSSNALPESAAEDEETKHLYVMQATFDLTAWPECKTENEHTNDIMWYMKVFSSETLAIVKDTDKEDKEKALKASWEANEAGRAEKAKRSRAKFIL